MDEIFSRYITPQQLSILSLPTACLPIHQEPLPQKQDFQHAPFLRRIAIEKALAHLYQDTDLTAHEIHIVILTHVLADGLGDFFTQTSTATALRDLYPHAHIHAIALHPESMQLPPHPNHVHFHSIPYTHTPNIPTHILPILKKSNCILQIPTYCSHIQKTLRRYVTQIHHRPSYELVGESGWGHTAPFSPATGARALGLHPWEKGILFPNISSSIPDPFVQQILQITRHDMLHIGYLRQPKSALMFLQTLLFLYQNIKDPIAVCLFPIEHIIRALPSLLPKLQQARIQTIDIYYEAAFSSIRLQENGKVLRLIQMPKCNQTQYHTLLAHSQSVSGCRGEGSLADLISLKKLPFFDLPSHKTPLLQGLHSISKHVLGIHHATTLYLQNFLQADLINPITLANLASHTDVILGWSRLRPILMSHYHAMPFLAHLTQRAIYQHFNPIHALWEQQKLAPFLSGEQSAFQALSSIQKMIYP